MVLGHGQQVARKHVRVHRQDAHGRMDGGHGGECWCVSHHVPDFHGGVDGPGVVQERKEHAGPRGEDTQRNLVPRAMEKGGWCLCGPWLRG